MNIVRLSTRDRSLLAARFEEHGNSYIRMRDALKEAGAQETMDRLNALRGIERRFAIDLGSVSWRHARRNRPQTHPIERMIMNYITEPRQTGSAGDELWVHLDRVGEIRELMEGRLVGEPES